MIVNYTEGGWEIVTQRAHGLLAAEIAQQWKYSARTKRWTELLMAIAEHDDAQIELERDNLLTPQGGPVDFKMKVFERRHCTQTMDFALSKSRYIALLCSMNHQHMQLTDQTLTVRPWPFESSGFEVSFETRLIPQLAFKNAAEFRSAFLEAEVTEKRWTFKCD